MSDKITYTIKQDGNSKGHPIGTLCYEFRGHDYGCAREDTMGMGEPYITMTLNDDGTGPFFTSPCASLDPEPIGHYFPPNWDALDSLARQQKR